MKKKIVFLDTNFLIASQITKHPFNNRVIDLLTKFYTEDFFLVSHALVFDEFWYVLLGLQNPNEKSVKAVKKATDNIFKFDNFSLLKTKFNQKDLNNVLNLMEKYRLKPRDALILQIMKIEKVTKLATFDKHFEDIKDIEIVK